MPGDVLSVRGGSTTHDGLEAIVAGPTTNANGRGALLWVYVSADGRRWEFDYSISATA